jgi:hypothetical protein
MSLDGTKRPLADLLNVRCCGKTGSDLVAVALIAHDPERTCRVRTSWPHRYRCAAPQSLRMISSACVTICRRAADGEPALRRTAEPGFGLVAVQHLRIAVTLHRFAFHRRAGFLAFGIEPDTAPIAGGQQESRKKIPAVRRVFMMCWSGQSGRAGTTATYGNLEWCLGSFSQNFI